jgi:hypothetical protein
MEKMGVVRRRQGCGQEGERGVVRRERGVWYK